MKGTQYGSYLVVNAKNSWFCVFIEMLIFYELINPRLVVSWWNLVAPGMANLDHYYDFKHGKCSLKDFSTLQTFNLNLLIQPSYIRNILVLKFQSRFFMSRPGLDYGQCLLFLAQWIFQRHNEMKNYKLRIRRSLTFFGVTSRLRSPQ